MYCEIDSRFRIAIRDPLLGNHIIRFILYDSNKLCTYILFDYDESFLFLINTFLTCMFAFLSSKTHSQLLHGALKKHVINFLHIPSSLMGRNSLLQARHISPLLLVQAYILRNN